MSGWRTARVKMQHEPAAEAEGPRSRVSAAFSHEHENLTIFLQISGFL